MPTETLPEQPEDVLHLCIGHLLTVDRDKFPVNLCIQDRMLSFGQAQPEFVVYEFSRKVRELLGTSVNLSCGYVSFF